MNLIVTFLHYIINTQELEPAVTKLVALASIFFLTNEVYFQGCRLCTEKLAESDATIGEYKDCNCTNADVRG